MSWMDLVWAWVHRRMIPVYKSSAGATGEHEGPHVMVRIAHKDFQQVVEQEGSIEENQTPG
jgi:hypothetical protein